MNDILEEAWVDHVRRFGLNPVSPEYHSGKTVTVLPRSRKAEISEKKWLSRRILAPAELPKQAATFDLPITLGILAGSGQVATERLADYAVVGENLISWLEWRDEAERPVPGYVEEELRGYLECGILCFGFGRAVCTGCGTGFVIAFSCKGRGVCPSCNGRRMAHTAAHLVDHVFPPVPVRQWVISVPKRFRGFLADRPAGVAALTKIFLAEIERLLCAAAGVTTGANTPTAARPRLGGVFTPAAAGSANDAPPAFLPAQPINPTDLAALTERVRRRLIRWFRRTRLLDAEAAADMLAWEDSGFSSDAFRADRDQ